jgi:amidase
MSASFYYSLALIWLSQIELNEYLTALKSVPTGVRTLTDLINFNNEHKELELPEHYNQQDLFVVTTYFINAWQILKPLLMYRLIQCDATNGRDEAYGKALARNLEVGATRGIDAALKKYNLDALVLPADGTSTPAGLRSLEGIVSIP